MSFRLVVFQTHETKEAGLELQSRDQTNHHLGAGFEAGLKAGLEDLILFAWNVFNVPAHPVVIMPNGS